MARLGLRSVLGTILLAVLAPAAQAGSVLVPAASVPTLDELALVGLAAAVGVAGVVALIRRRK